jgi:hypothetical protein
MRRIRLSTSLLLVVIAALGTALVSQELRHRKIEAKQAAECVDRMENERIQYFNAMKDKEAEMAEERRRLGVVRFRDP